MEDYERYLAGRACLVLEVAGVWPCELGPELRSPLRPGFAGGDVSSFPADLDHCSRVPAEVDPPAWRPVHSAVRGDDDQVVPVADEQEGRRPALAGLAAG